jgi:radical SAM protein with 4Fe4S-binding SPASM domain
MSLDIAKSAIDKHLTNSDDFDEIEIDLFGGEPFLRPDFVQDLCEWTWNQGYSIPKLFFVDTNGTKVHGEIQKWLTKYKDFINLGLSLDGTPETHNRNRNNSYSEIDIDFFLKTYPNQPIRMTITSQTIGNLSEDIIHLHKLGFLVTSSFAQGVKWNMKKNKYQLSYELNKLCEFYLLNPKIIPCSLFEMNLLLVNTKTKQKKWCGCGTNMVTLDIDGKEYPCQLFLPSSMPDGKNWDKINFSENQNFSDDECYSCLIKNICPTCYGANLITNNDIKKRDKSLCELYKIQALANSYLKGLMIEKEVLSPDNMKDTYNIIKAINKIQKEIIN